jgi:hypothetical protein
MAMEVMAPLQCVKISTSILFPAVWNALAHRRVRQAETPFLRLCRREQFSAIWCAGDVLGEGARDSGHNISPPNL